MGRKKQHDDASLDPVLSRGVIAIILVICAIIVTLSFFDKAGIVGILLDEWVLSFLFGSMRYAVPGVIIILAWYIVKDRGHEYRSTHGIGAILFFIATSSSLHMEFAPDDMWQQAINGHGGGAFGMLAWVFKTYLGSLASWVLLIGTICVSVLLIFNTSLAHAVVFHKKLMTKLGFIGSGINKMVDTLFVGQEPDEQETESWEQNDDEETSGMFKQRSLTEQDEEEPDEQETESWEQNDDEETSGNTNEHIQKETTPKVQQKNQNMEIPPWQQHALIKPLPSLSLLLSKKEKPTSGDIEAIQRTIQDTLAEFKIDVSMSDVRVGPTVTQYSFKPAKGVKLSRITSLSNDLALALAAHPIRIEAPIPGRSLVGVEVPNTKAAIVTLKELLENKGIKHHSLMVALGKDVGGHVWFADLPRMPHLLIAGATGSGKTVCMNIIIMSLLYQNTAADVRIIMVDPKRVELTLYNGIPHLLTPVITNTQKTVNALKWTIGEMDRRFELLSQAGNRDVTSYNAAHPKRKLPHIIFIIDELADLMATAANDVEAGIIRLAQMARAVGIHLVVATQRPSVDVITGLMKANIPARIAFSVASLTDSRTILDASGAEKLLGRGDMLFQTAELSKPVRIQGAFISEEEVKRVVTYLKGNDTPLYDESIVEKQTGKGTLSLFGGPTDDQDPLFMEAKHAILEAGKASASFLQRKLKIGYARAARVLDELEEAGIIGPVDGAKPREILVTEQEIEETSMGLGQELNVFEDTEETSQEDQLEEGTVVDEYEEMDDETEKFNENEGGQNPEENDFDQEIEEESHDEENEENNDDPLQKNRYE